MNKIERDGTRGRQEGPRMTRIGADSMKEQEMKKELSRHGIRDAQDALSVGSALSVVESHSLFTGSIQSILLSCQRRMRNLDRGLRGLARIGSEDDVRQRSCFVLYLISAHPRYQRSKNEWERLRCSLDCTIVSAWSMCDC